MALWIRTALPRRSPARQVKFLVGLFGLLALIGCQPELIPLPQPLPATPTAPVETVQVVTMVVHPTEAVNATQAVHPPEVSSPPSPTPEPDADMANLLAMPAIHVLVISNGGEGFVNLRSGPSSRYDVFEKVPTGATVAAIAVSEHGEWLLVRDPIDPNKLGWLYRLYTNFDPGTQKLPVMKNLPGAATKAP